MESQKFEVSPSLEVQFCAKTQKNGITYSLIVLIFCDKRVCLPISVIFIFKANCPQENYCFNKPSFTKSQILSSMAHNHRS
jgi:hypothetical protein